MRKEMDAFVDPTLHRQKVSWQEVGVPQSVEGIAEDVWTRFAALAAPGGDSPEQHVALDQARAAYHAYYAEAEAIAQSTIHALRPKAGSGTRGAAKKRDGSPGGAPRAAAQGAGADLLIRVAERVVPPRLRRRVSPVWRSRIMRAANRVARLLRR
jgi:hypothetical protein